MSSKSLSLRTLQFSELSALGRCLILQFSRVINSEGILLLLIIKFCTLKFQIKPLTNFNVSTRHAVIHHCSALWLSEDCTLEFLHIEQLAQRIQDISNTIFSAPLKKTNAYFSRPEKTYSLLMSSKQQRSCHIYFRC